MPSLNDDDLFDFNDIAEEFEDNDYDEALKAHKVAMGKELDTIKSRAHAAKVRAELMGARRADAIRAATAAIGSAQGHELASPDATRTPQALESDEVIDPQVANLEAEVSRLQQDITRLETAAQRASNLQEQLDERDRLVASKDAEILRLNNALTTALRNIGTPPAPTPTPGPAPAGPAPAPAQHPRHATPAPTPPAPSATAAPAQPATPATPAPAQPATPTQPATPAARTQQAPPRRTPDPRPAGNFGPAAGEPSQTANPATRVIPAQPQRQPQRQPRQGWTGWLGNVILGPNPEQPSRTRQSR